MQVKDDISAEAGVTLVELTLYMLFASLIIFYALSMATSASRSYVRGREVSKIQSNGRYAMAILARDVMNTGYKAALSDETGVLRVKQFSGTWVGDRVEPSPSADSAGSINFYEGIPGDTLEIFKAEMINDTLDEVIRARYFLDSNNIMWRITRKFDSSAVNYWVDGDTVALSKNIEALQFRFSTDGVNWFDDPVGNRNKIRAIQMEILMRTGREVTGPTGNSYIMGNIVFTPPAEDAQYLRRRYLEIVEVVNNGILF